MSGTQFDPAVVGALEQVLAGRDAPEWTVDTVTKGASPAPRSSSPRP
jgi:hypothetical protein